MEKMIQFSIWAKPGLPTRFFFLLDGGTGKVRPSSLPDVAGVGGKGAAIREEKDAGGDTEYDALG